MPQRIRVALKRGVVRDVSGEAEAGRNPGLTIPGGTNNPIRLDRGAPADGFRLVDVATDLDASDSSMVKRRFPAENSNILVHAQ